MNDWLSCLWHEQLYRMQDEYGRFSLRAWINNNSFSVTGVAMLAFLALLFTLGAWLWPSAGQPSFVGRQAWFYDFNTGNLFKASSKHLGPIAAPSGPQPDGTEAGFRAHTYSYGVNPSDADLFVGFIERPDPSPNAPSPVHAMDDSERWCQGRQIRRLDEEEWVSAASDAGRKIIEDLAHPNEDGQTPIYQVVH